MRSGSGRDSSAPDEMRERRDHEHWRGRDAPSNTSPVRVSRDASSETTSPIRVSRDIGSIALQFVPPPVPGPPDGRAGFGCSAASVLGSLRVSSSECGGFVPGSADGSLVVFRVGPAQAIALTLSASSARHTRDFVMIGHHPEARIAGAVPAAPLGGTSVATPSRRTMTIREPQWPRDFLDRRLRTMKGIAKRRRSIPMTIGLRRRIVPRPRNTVVTPIA